MRHRDTSGKQSLNGIIGERKALIQSGHVLQLTALKGCTDRGVGGSDLTGSGGTFRSGKGCQHPRCVVGVHSVTVGKVDILKVQGDVCTVQSTSTAFDDCLALVFGRPQIPGSVQRQLAPSVFNVSLHEGMDSGVCAVENTEAVELVVHHRKSGFVVAVGDGWTGRTSQKGSRRRCHRKPCIVGRVSDCGHSLAGVVAEVEDFFVDACQTHKGHSRS